jgi:hypothetical protein
MNDIHIQELLNSLKTEYLNCKDCKGSHDTFVTTTLNKLNQYTKIWNMIWDVTDQGYHTSFYTDVTSNGTHLTQSTQSFPLELIPYLVNLIYCIAQKGHNGSKNFSVSFDHSNNNSRMYFNCFGTFNEGYYVRCTNCGSCWDGNAQCMCHLYLDDNNENFNNVNHVNNVNTVNINAATDNDNETETV